MNESPSAPPARGGEPIPARVGRDEHERGTVPATAESFCDPLVGDVGALTRKIEAEALLLNAVSLTAALGVVTFLWQQGHLTHALFASPATGAVTLWVPLAVFSLLFGLSMDYELFILTRFKEEYQTDRDTSAATVRAIGRTGRLVSSGALILCLAFIALGGVPQTDVTILSTGLAAGIIIDATIVRGILAPALLALLGHYNWAMPARVAGILHIEPLPGPSRD